jgi:hypothetical protein
MRCLKSVDRYKSHLAVALGVEAAKVGRSVCFARLADIVGLLAKTEREGQLRERIRFLARTALLIVDEIGYLPVTPGGGNLFCNSSTLATSAAPSSPRTAALPSRARSSAIRSSSRRTSIGFGTTPSLTLRVEHALAELPDGPVVMSFPRAGARLHRPTLAEPQSCLRQAITGFADNCRHACAWAADMYMWFALAGPSQAA